MRLGNIYLKFPNLDFYEGKLLGLKQFPDVSLFRTLALTFVTLCLHTFLAQHIKVGVYLQSVTKVS